MGIPAAVTSNLPDNDFATGVAGSFTATGLSPVMMFWGTFNLALYGDSGPNGNWNASVQLERSFDGGTTWIVCQDSSTSSGQAIYNVNNLDVSRLAGEPEQGVLYRLHCTAYTSKVNYRLSQSPGAQLNWTPNGSP